jgi:colanic acid/amylovoran biosynthesis glycosyltransferase
MRAGAGVSAPATALPAGRIDGMGGAAPQQSGAAQQQSGAAQQLSGAAQQQSGAAQQQPTAAAGGAAIAYVVSRFPKLTETFVVRELIEMERLGARIELFALQRGREAVVQEDLEQLACRASYGFLFSREMLRAHWFFLSRRPGVYLRAFTEAVSGTWRSLNYLAGAVLFFPRAVCFAYRVERSGVAHIHAQFANHPALAALVMSRLTGIPFSFSARGSDIHVNRTMLREKVAAARFVIAVSHANRNVILAACDPHAADKVHVVYGGIDTDRFAPSRTRPEPPPLRILCVGRFEEVKGHATLIAACAELARRGVPFECHLAGEGRLRGQIEMQIAGSGLDDSVILHGAVPQAQVARLLGTATVFVLATLPAANGKKEGIPNVLKEAMACALPVVASDISGIPELVEHGRTGLLVPPGQPAAVADALELLASNRRLRERIGRAACAVISARFDVTSSTRRRAALFLGTPPGEPLDVPQVEAVA